MIEVALTDGVTRRLILFLIYERYPGKIDMQLVVTSMVSGIRMLLMLLFGWV